MKDLFYRNFSSVHVAYIPLQGFGQLGTTSMINTQVERLRIRIRHDSKAVQQRRAEAWTRLDSMQLSILFAYAFEHLAKGNDSPFDFSTCRRENESGPTTIQAHLARFLSFNPRAEFDDNFQFAAKVIGSCLVRHELKMNGSGECVTSRMLKMRVDFH